MTPTISRTKQDTRIYELCQKVAQMAKELKRHRMAEAFSRWDGNLSTKDQAGQLMQQFSNQWDEDLEIDLPELYESKE